ncbi:OpgC domain-containing protein [Microbacterium enclense]|uniref:OpgC domain-containing protein n=1 Tax=Microbacterium enclense TaxID=993073 RepID=UPI00344AB5A5
MRRLARSLVAAAALGAASLMPAAPASAAADPGDGVLFGAELDWGHDGPDGYRERLGAAPSMYSVRLPYPIDDRAVSEWQRAADEAARQGAALVLDLEPSVALDALTDGDAAELNRRLEAYRSQTDAVQFVRFAPEMNGSWVTWGQQPTAYVRAFEQVADAVHAGSSHAQTVWAPSYGAGYPFERADGRLDSVTARDLAALDTDDDGLITEADDPYGPYFPDADAVDLVGLTMYYFGKGESAAAAGRDVPLEDNSAPEDGEVAARLEERWGYTVPQRGSFSDRFSAQTDTPLLLDTGALYDPARDGDSEREVKQGWWRQVLDALPDHPLISGVTWLEVVRDEAEAGGQEVDWRATADRDLATSLRDDLDSSGMIRWGPVTTVVTAEEAVAATVQVREDGTVTPAGWIAGSAAVLALAFLASGMVGRLLPRWRYDETGVRDRRIDMVRGILVVGAVVTFVEVASPLSVVADGLGAFTGPELFVLLSGFALGMARPLAGATWRRARRLYLSTLGVVVAVFALGFVPFVDVTPVTAFVDRGAADGTRYDLYPNADRLLDYPPPAYAVRQLLLLEMGPWPLTMMGLFIALALLTPLLLWMLRRRLWWLALSASWAAYIVGVAQPDLLRLPSQFDALYPLALWQLVFVHALVAGFFRDRLVRALTSRPGKLVAGLFVVGSAAALVLLWVGPQTGVVPPLFAADMQTALAAGWDRVMLGWGRLLDLVLVAVCAFAVLTVAWRPLAAVAGWLLIPLGRASLFVVIALVFVVVVVAAVPGIDRESLWQGTLVHVSVLAVLLLGARWLLRSPAARG